MSDVFFSELGIRKPDYNLKIGSGSHGAQTGRMLIEIEEILIEQKPDMVVVYGDTNSTIAGALAASKLHIPIAHIEAGLRSYNKQMPEEINRILTDHISDLLFVPSESSKQLLEHEGIKKGVINGGDIMYDAVLATLETCDTKVSLQKFNLTEYKYYFATIHRPHNTDSKTNLKTILEAFDSLDSMVLFPAHPRTRKKIKEYGLDVGTNIKLIEPLGYSDTVALLSKASCIITDSGGLQKEAYYVKTRCVTIRPETEWIETLNNGWNCLVSANITEIKKAVDDGTFPGEQETLYGSGNTAETIVSSIESFFNA